MGGGREGERVDDSAGGSRDLWLLTVRIQLPKFGLGTQIRLDAPTCLVMNFFLLIDWPYFYFAN